MAQNLEKLIERLEKAVSRLEKCGTGAPLSDEEYAENPFTEFENTNLSPILPLAADFPDAIKRMTELFVEAHKTAGKIVEISLHCTKPAQDEMQELHDPITKAVSEIEKLGGYKRDVQYNHGQLLKEAARTASWVLADRTPVDYIDTTFQVGEYFGLQVVREYKGKNDKYVQWFNAIKNYCHALQDFVKENFRTGLTWKANGISIAEFTGQEAAAEAAAEKEKPAPKAEAAPAPAPAPKPKAAINPAALFGELNQGTGITGRLRKVTDAEKTKNRPREERVFTVPSEVGVKKEAPKPAPKVGAKPAPAPVFRSIGTKLQIENQLNNHDLKFESGGNQQTIYMYNCKNTDLVVKGKLNQVVLDKCTKCKIIVDTVISSFEVINSRDIDIQIIDVCASVLAESSESIRVYVSEAGVPKVEIFSAKSSNVCVYAPGKRIDPDTKEEIEGMIEHALPSTLRSIFKDGELAHDFVKHG